jgi:SulP family sulfate permease
MEVKNRDVAAELLKVGLKLTKERMDAITSYVIALRASDLQTWY